MGFKIKYTYPDGETEIEDEVYDTEQQAVWAAEDGVNGFATGAEILDDMAKTSWRAPSSTKSSKSSSVGQPE